MKNARFPLLPFCLCLIGLAFCIWVNFSGGTPLCLTDGCALFQDFSLAGVSLWTAGSALFGILLVLCALRLTRLARTFAAFALGADLALMAVMSLTAPCVNCLIAGLLIALTFFSLLREISLQTRARRSFLLLAWALLFVISAGGVLRGSMELWSPLPRPEQVSVQVFFSPSCRACQALTEQSDALPDAAWYPVAEDSRDIWLIHAMSKALAAGSSLPEALAKAHASLPGLADAPDLMTLPEYRFGLLKPDMLLLQLRLWKNRAHVLSAGSDRLPFVEFRGLPAFLRGDAPNKTAESTPPLNAPAAEGHAPLPGIDLGIAGFCGGKTDSDDCSKADSAPRSELSQPGPIDTSGMVQ